MNSSVGKNFLQVKFFLLLAHPFPFQILRIWQTLIPQFICLFVLWIDEAGNNCRKIAPT